MTYPLPDQPQPPEGAAPDTSLNNGNDQLLPPYGASASNPRPGYWAVPPQPQAPTWPYAGAPVYPPLPGMPDTTIAEEIGPDHVPWKWYDVVGAGCLFIIILGLTLLAHFLPSNATAGTTDVPLSTGALVFSTLANIAVYGVILLFIWLCTVHKYRLRWSALGVRRIPGINAVKIMYIILTFVGMYVLALVVSAVVIYVFYGGHATNPQEKEITGGGSFSWVKFVLALIVASIAAPVVEELFFRGVLYGWLRTRWHAVAGVILSAAIFSSAHAIPLILASIFVVGVTLAIVYEKTKSTLATMMLHSAFNTVGVILAFYQLARK